MRNRANTQYRFGLGARWTPSKVIAPTDLVQVAQFSVTNQLVGCCLNYFRFLAEFLQFDGGRVDADLLGQLLQRLDVRRNQCDEEG